MRDLPVAAWQDSYRLAVIYDTETTIDRYQELLVGTYLYEQDAPISGSPTVAPLAADSVKGLDELVLLRYSKVTLLSREEQYHGNQHARRDQGRPPGDQIPGRGSRVGRLGRGVRVRRTRWHEGRSRAQPRRLRGNDLRA